MGAGGGQKLRCRWAGGHGVKGKVMRVLHIVFQTVGMAVLCNDAHSQ